MTYRVPTAIPIAITKAIFLNSRRRNRTMATPTRQNTPSGRTTAVDDANRLASTERSFLTARNAPKMRAVASGSDPPRNERCIQSKLSRAKSPAIHPPQSRYANTTLSNEDTEEINNNELWSETWVRTDSA